MARKSKASATPAPSKSSQRPAAAKNSPAKKSPTRQGTASKKRPSPVSTLKVAGKKFAFTGKLDGNGALEHAHKLVEAEGGAVQKDVTADMDYLVVGQTRGAGPSGAEKKGSTTQSEGGQHRGRRSVRVQHTVRDHGRRSIGHVI